MKTKTLLGITALLSMLLTMQLSAVEENAWELQKDEAGIAVYVREVPGSKFKEFKAVATFEASVTSIVAILRDADAFAEWMPETKACTLLEITETEQYHHLISDTPWPVKNRDGVYHFTYHQDPQTQAMSVVVEDVPEYLPIQKDPVRIAEAKGGWQLIPMETGGIYVEYQLHLDPGGNLPAGLSNRTLAERPFELLNSLRERLRQKDALRVTEVQ